MTTQGVLKLEKRMSNITRNTPDMATRIKIYERLKVAIAISDGKVCRYKPEESDARIAQEIGVTPAAVQNTRVNIFGKLAAPEPSKSLEERISAIEEFLTRNHSGWNMRDAAE